MNNGQCARQRPSFSFASPLSEWEGFGLWQFWRLLDTRLYTDMHNASMSSVLRWARFCIPIRFITLTRRTFFFLMSRHHVMHRFHPTMIYTRKTQIANQRMTFLVGPEAQEPFCKAPDEVLSQQEVYEFMKPVFGAGVVYDATKKRRQMQFQSMANGLRTSRLKAYIAKIERETREFLREEWGEGSGEVDLLQTLSDLTILTSSRCLHGDDVREKLFKEVSHLYHDLDQGVTPLTVFLPNLPTKAHIKRNIARKEMVSLFGKVIKNRRDNPNETHSDGTVSAITEEILLGIVT